MLSVFAYSKSFNEESKMDWFGKLVNPSPHQALQQKSFKSLKKIFQEINKKYKLQELRWNF